MLMGSGICAAGMPRVGLGPESGKRIGIALQLYSVRIQIGKGSKPIIGEDSVPWKEVIAVCREVGGSEWFIVEQENYLPGKTPLECSVLSLKGLKTILGEKKS
jgi:hypothetical protein